MNLSKIRKKVGRNIVLSFFCGERKDSNRGDLQSTWGADLVHTLLMNALRMVHDPKTIPRRPFTLVQSDRGGKCLANGEILDGTRCSMRELVLVRGFSMDRKFKRRIKTGEEEREFIKG